MRRCTQHNTVVFLNFKASSKAVGPPNFPTVESTVIFCGVNTLEGITSGGISAEILKTTGQVKKKKNRSWFP